MSAVLEREPEVYRMPQPRVHQVVTWYQHGQTNDPPKPALVLSIVGNCVYLMNLSPGRLGEELGTVQHVSDPSLKGNEFVRKQRGGWDFTEHDKGLDRERKLQSERIAAVERRLEKLVADLGGEKGKSK